MTNHSSRAHATLSASGAHRWIHCTPSALLEADKPDGGSDAARQGTAAHELAEYKLLKHLGEKVPDQPPHDPDWYDQEMEQHTSDYADYCAALAQKLPDSTSAVEIRLDLTAWVPDGFGTCDFMLASEKELHIVDFKYGAGVQVDAKDNPQLRLYALGALAYFDWLYPQVETVTAHIFQPRRNSISRETLSAADLRKWGDTVVKPAAEKAAVGEGDFTPGSWCGFCKIQATCRALAEENLRLAAKILVKPPELANDEVADVLRQLPALTRWANAVEKHALSQALQGEKYPGFKVVEGRSIRKISDPAAFTLRAVKAGYLVEDVSETKLKGITALEKTLGKKEFAEIAGDLVVKPAGAPTLVPESDKRPEITTATAADVFGLPK